MGTAKNFFVYILASRRNGTLYTGMTADLPGRVYTHREDLIAGFTRRHGVHVFVWYERVEFAEPAIRREKQIKKWRRAWKLELIEKMNPNWDDLFPQLFEWGHASLRNFARRHSRESGNPDWAIGGRRVRPGFPLSRE